MTDWNKLKVVDLKAELKKRGLLQTGLKPALVSRLTAADNGDGSESEATVHDDAPKIASSPDTISSTQPVPDSSTGLPTEDTSAEAPLPVLETTDPITAPEIASSEAVATEAISETLSTQISNEVPQATSEAEAHRSELPSVEPQELIEDRQKRKRRSQSPAPPAVDTSRKRQRPDEEIEGVEDEVITTTDDAVWVEKHNGVDPGEVNAASKEVAQDGEGVEPGPTIVDDSKAEVIVEDVTMKNGSPGQEGEESKQPLGNGLTETNEDSPSRVRERDSRYKDLFSPPTAPALENSKSQDTMDVDPDRDISPAIHPATAAIYIRDFMRPLNPTQLQNHLVSLATPPNQEVDRSILVDFYLDPIRTHALISFTNISAASRVRSALHGCIWPEERTRKPLWVDFIPLDKVQEWTEKEEATKAGGRAGAKKWEVVYETDEERRVTAYLQEVGAAPVRTQSISYSETIPTPVSAPALKFTAPSGPRAADISAPKSVTDMKTLDELFNSTESKPRLYWLPVDKSLANKRLDGMEDVTSKRYTTGMGGDINRYTFEDGDVLVDRGPEIFPGIRPPGGHRGGPRGGHRGGGGRGKYQGRGGYGGGDSYRGGRRGPDRRPSWDARR